MNMYIFHVSDSDTSPGLLLRDGAAGALASAKELRASSPEVAGQFLDIGLDGRVALSLRNFEPPHQNLKEVQGFFGSSTFLYTLHVYQYSVDKTGKGGGGWIIYIFLLY